MFWKIAALLTAVPVMLGVSLHLSAEARGSSQLLTLVAEITVENGTDSPIDGYVHRVAVPVEGHMQQRLQNIRHDAVTSFTRKSFKHGAGDYVELEWDVPANSTSVKKVYFDLLVTSYRIPSRQRDWQRLTQQPPPDVSYLQPAKYIESDADEIVRLARHIERSYADDEERLRAAFLTPQQMIQYRRQSTRGALYAVSARQGDCTEYAALFVAIARAMGYPARITSEFLFTEHREFSQPNHHAAEVYLNGRWVPVDANLALDPKFGYGFGVGQQSKVVLNRNSVWVWSNLFPRGVSKRPGDVNVDMQWRILDTQGAD